MQFLGLLITIFLFGTVGIIIIVYKILLPSFDQIFRAPRPATYCRHCRKPIRGSILLGGVPSTWMHDGIYARCADGLHDAWPQ